MFGSPFSLSVGGQQQETPPLPQRRDSGQSGVGGASDSGSSSRATSRPTSQRYDLSPMTLPEQQQNHHHQHFFSPENLSVSVPVCSLSPTETTLMVRLSLNVLGNVRSWEIQRNYTDLCCLYDEMQALHKSISVDLPSLPTQEQQGGHFFEHFLKSMVEYCVRVENSSCTERLLAFFDGKAVQTSLGQEYHMQKINEQVKAFVLRSFRSIHSSYLTLLFSLPPPIRCHN